MMLSDVVTVARRFQRSVRIDTDLGAPNALQGFVCHESGRMALETMARLVIESGQRAFTWTGPYGGGKSSLALAFGTFLGNNPAQRKIAEASFGDVPLLRQAFPLSDEGWLVIPVIGRRADPVDDLTESLDAAVSTEVLRSRPKKGRNDPSGRNLISRLELEAKIRPDSGVLLLIDEMGKFLEGAAVDGSDIHFFQELAEAASRCEGRLVVLGILHQAFERYASRLGRETRDEWAKVQGRYVDIPVVTATDEVIDLIGQAVVTEVPHPQSLAIAEEVAEAIRRRRPGSPADLSNRLNGCWPLHPVTAALIGPVSRRRFGQNERSTFGFLGSSEPEGFQEFLRSTPLTDLAFYEPARLWDYLRINLEPAILASPDGHRWAQGAEAVERAMAKGGPLHVRLAKAIALIDLFRNGSGLVPERAVLRSSIPDASEDAIEQALQDLEQWSITVFRKHIDAWAVYAGSDFDIDEAVKTAVQSLDELDFSRLARLAGLQPLLAKQHYHRTGTLRWFDTELTSLSQVKDSVRSFSAANGASGKFILAIPNQNDSIPIAHKKCRDASRAAEDFPVTVGLTPKAWLIRELGAELIALETVRATRSELEGDSVARREIAARIAVAGAQLEEELREAFAQATWYVWGKSYTGGDLRSLSRLVSELADQTFLSAPHIHSELINRERPSSNSQAAVRQLLYAMVEHPDEQYLGIAGYPAERGLYSTILEVSGLHRQQSDGLYGFSQPSASGEGDTYQPFWRTAEELLSNAEGILPLSKIYEAWSRPPFGLRPGVLPVLAAAFILAHRSSIAVYAEGAFRPELDRLFVDLLLQSEKLIGLRRVALTAENKNILRDVALAIGNLTGQQPESEPLSVAKSLVRFVFNLPPWARRTAALSEQAVAVRRVLLSASDPHRALFVDLPVSFEGTPTDQIGERIGYALQELAEAYPRMLAGIQGKMLAALGYKSADFTGLGQRAQTVVGLSGDLRLDAFATRLVEFSGRPEDMESICGMAINKPARDWSERDPDQAALAIAELALQFRQAEILARVKGREPTQHAIAVVFGTGEGGYTLMKSFDISEADRKEASSLAQRLLRTLNESKSDPGILLAALAEAGAQALSDAEGSSAEQRAKKAGAGS